MKATCLCADSLGDGPWRWLRNDVQRVSVLRVP